MSSKIVKFLPQIKANLNYNCREMYSMISKNEQLSKQIVSGAKHASGVTKGPLYFQNYGMKMSHFYKNIKKNSFYVQSFIYMILINVILAC